MARARYRWNIHGDGGFVEQRRKPETVALLAKVAEAIRAGAGSSGPGDGYTASVVQGKTRARATVAAHSTYARRDNAEDNSIMKSVDLGRAVL